MRRATRLLARLRGAARPGPAAAVRDGARADPVARPRADDRERGRAAAAELRHREAEARYHRDRLALYNARILSGKQASASRLEELRRISTGADARLAHLKSVRDGAEGPTTPPPSDAGR